MDWIYLVAFFKIASVMVQAVAAIELLQLWLTMREARNAVPRALVAIGLVLLGSAMRS